MAFRSDILFNFEESPRVATVESPSVELSVQDMHDTFTDTEDSILGAQFENLILSAGKEDLGGGTLVGITSELQNIQVTFEDRAVVLSTASVTTPDVLGILVTDSAGTFQTDLVSRGDLVVNSTDGSHATVLQVVSETVLDTQPLAGGTDNQYDTSDVINVFKIYVCTISGGNTTAIDDVDASLNPVLQSFGTQIKVSASSSATLQEQGDIQRASFDGSVHIDTGSGISGTVYPAGNTANPVDNLVDAVVIESVQQFKAYTISSNLTLSNEASWEGILIIGHSVLDTLITVGTLANVTNTEFRNCSIDGELGEVTLIKNCFIGELAPLVGLKGNIENCDIGPQTITVSGTSSDTVRFKECRDSSGANPVTIDLNGDGPEVDLQNLVGRFQFINKSGEARLDIHCNGNVTLDQTITNGIIHVSGNGELTNHSGLGATVVDSMVHGDQITQMWKWDGLEFGNPLVKTPTGASTEDDTVAVFINRQQSLMNYGTSITETITRRPPAGQNFFAPLTADLVDDINGLVPTYTRATTGTGLDSGSNLITTSAIDTPRYEVGGILIERGETNTALGSNLFEDQTYWAWNDGTATYDPSAVTANPVITGSTSWTHTNPAQTNANRNQVVGTFVNGQEDIAWIILENVDALVSDVAIFDETALQTVHRAEFTWATMSMVTTAGSGQTFVQNMGTGPNGGAMVKIGVSAVGTPSGTGGGGNSRAMYFYYTGLLSSSLQAIVHHAQFEEDTLFPSSAVETVASPVARSPDFLSYADGVGASSALNDLEGSIRAEITPEFSSTQSNPGVIVNIIDQLAGVLYINDDTTQKVSISDGTNVASLDPAFVRGQTYKVAVRWNTVINEIQVVVDGVSGTPQSYDGALSRTGSTIYVGSTSTGNHFNGNIRNVIITSNDRGEDQLKIDTA